jgi:glycerophosphoryl diester phosphodiesterase
MDIHLHQGEVIVAHDYSFDKKKDHPRLKDILGKIIDKGRIELEIKAMSTQIIEKLYPLLSTHPQADIELTTSVFPLARFIKEAFPDRLLGVIFPPPLFEAWMSESFVSQKIAAWMTLMEADIAHLPFPLVTTTRVAHLHDRGLRVHTHIPDDSDQIEKLRRLQRLGVDQCTFDNINLLQARNR